MKNVRMRNLWNLFGVGMLNRWQRALAVVLVCAATTTTVPAQVVVTFKNLANFDLTDGNEPNGLVQGVDGNFYGTTDLGGANSCNCGVIFKITPGGNLSALYSFSGPDGEFPAAGLTLGSDGNFYGTTSSGGSNQGGTVFQFNPSTKAVTVLYNFPETTVDGEYPEAALVLGSDGNFYGTTSGGGKYSSGVVFKITPSGALTTLYSFCKKGYPCTSDGMEPETSLMQLLGGPFYGTTNSGGEHMSGTLFAINPTTKALVKLYDFESAPSSGLVQGSKGELYGTSGYGGAYGYGSIYEIGYLGGTPTTIYSFCQQQPCTDGENPTGQLLIGTDGNLYGTTYSGGTGDGAIYLINPTGIGFTPLHNFAGTDGLNPASGMIEATSGILYGTTTGGGTSTACSGQPCGTVFSLTSNALHRFIETVPIAGPVGPSPVIILGNGLTGATSVTFNGTAATFSVTSPTEITATVPSGATTGRVKVVTSAGKTLTSNVAFVVTP